MERRANINIQVANHLSTLYNADLGKCQNNISNCLKNCNEIKNHDDIGHIIIGRWYYGVYLLAKDKLVQNSLQKESDVIRHKGKNSIWNLLLSHYDGKFTKILQRGVQLAKKREHFEYNSYKCSVDDLLEFRELFNKIYEVLKNEQYKR